MPMLFSEICKRASVDDQVIRSMIDSKRDFDVLKLAAKHVQSNAERIERTVQRAYGKLDVSTPVLSNISFDYGEQDFIADLVSPIVPGNIERKYPKFSRKDRASIKNLAIGSDGRIPEGEITIAFATYVEAAFGEKQRVDLNAVAQSADGIDLMDLHMAAIMNDLLMRRENAIATEIMTSGNYASGCTSALSSTNRWDVAPATSTADPLKDLRVTAKLAVALGSSPNALIASSPVLEYLRTHPSVRAVAGIAATARVVPDEELKRLIGVDFILEGKVKYNTTGDAATETYAYLWGKGCVLAKIKPGAGRLQQCFAKTFRHTPLSFRDERDGLTGVRGTTWMVGTHEDADVITMSDAAYLLDTVIS